MPSSGYLCSRSAPGPLARLTGVRPAQRVQVITHEINESANEGPDDRSGPKRHDEVREDGRPLEAQGDEATAGDLVRDRGPDEHGVSVATFHEVFDAVVITALGDRSG